MSWFFKLFGCLPQHLRLTNWLLHVCGTAVCLSFLADSHGIETMHFYMCNRKIKLFEYTNISSLQGGFLHFIFVHASRSAVQILLTSRCHASSNTIADTIPSVCAWKSHIGRLFQNRMPSLAHKKIPLLLWIHVNLVRQFAFLLFYYHSISLTALDGTGLAVMLFHPKYSNATVYLTQCRRLFHSVNVALTIS